MDKSDGKLAIGILYEIWARVTEPHLKGIATLLAIVGLFYIIESFVIDFRKDKND